MPVKLSDYMTFFDLFDNCYHSSANLYKTVIDYTPKPSSWVTLSSGENCIKLSTIVFDIIAFRQTNRRTDRQTDFVLNYVVESGVPTRFFVSLSHKLFGRENHARWNVALGFLFLTLLSTRVFLYPYFPSEGSIVIESIGRIVTFKFSRRFMTPTVWK